MLEVPPYQLEAPAVVERLESDAQRGLSQAESRRRLERDGPNELQPAESTPWWKRFLEQFKNTLVVILLVATVISFIEWFFQDPRETALPFEGIVIFAIVILNALLGFFQESRAERAVEALMAMSVPESTVVRDGQRQRVPARELVRGDVLLLEAGDRVPADARLIEGVNLRSDEAALTGESVPTRKSGEPVPGESGLGDQHNMLFAGTTVTYGRGRAVVVATGMQTEVGHIAGMIQSAVKEATPLQKELDRMGKILSAAMLGICALVFVTAVIARNAHDASSILQLFLFAVALAVAAIPEALPAIVTAGLAIGVQRMAASNAIVRKLPAVETLGCATVICSDKTGTLTRNEMTVRKIFLPSQEANGTCVDVSGGGYDPEGALTINDRALSEHPPALRAAVEWTLRAAALANDAELIYTDNRWGIQGDPTEGALVVAYAKLIAAGAAVAVDSITVSDYANPPETNSRLPTLAAVHERFPRVGEIPFTSERKRHTTVHFDAEHADQVVVFLKGAPDVVIELCTSLRVDDQDVPLSDARRAEIMRQNEALAGQALRTLAMAYRPMPRPARRAQDQEWSEHEVEHDLIFLGIVGMIDPPREEAYAAVKTCYRAGIRPVMITGDHPQTAVAIAKDLGIMREGQRVLTGAELSRLEATALDQAVREVQVYARVNPEHKLRIVQALQRQGEIVAMTGDGVNDAPALKMANIGVAMGITGTDVSKEAADMVLTDDNFASIVKAIEEGRGIFDNIRKYLYYLLSSNTGELLTMFLGVMLAGVLGLINPGDGGFFLPLLAVQILWINLITDGPPALALGIEPKDPAVMDRPPRQHGTGVITWGGWIMISGVGVVMMVGTLFVLDACYPGGLFNFWVRETNLDAADRYARTMAFTTLVMFQMFNACYIKTLRSYTREGSEAASSAASERTQPDASNIQGRPVAKRASSALRLVFTNRWFWLALVISITLQILVVYVPVLQTAFSTTALTGIDWLRTLVITSSVLWIGLGVTLLSRAWPPARARSGARQVSVP